MRWQRGLSVSYAKVGGVLASQGHGPDALAAFRQALATVGALAAFRTGFANAEALVVRDPANTEWHRVFLVIDIRVGEVLVAQGDGPGALAAFRQALAIAGALAAHDPANTQWQRDLSVSHNK